jgi:hypothetical protein
MDAADGAMDKRVHAATAHLAVIIRAKSLSDFVFADVYIEVTRSEPWLLSDRRHVPFA